MELLFAAKRLAAAMQTCTNFACAKPLKSKKWLEPYGHFVRVAQIQDSIWLTIGKGKYFESESEVPWVGFETQKLSDQRAIISRLADPLRKKFKIVLMLEGDQPWPGDRDKHIIAERYFDAEKNKGGIWLEPFYGFGVCFPPSEGFNLLFALEFISEVLQANGYEDRWLVDEAGRDLAALSAEENAGTRQQLIQARLWQGRYREALMALWDRKCAVLGVTLPEVLRASHVVGFAQCANNDERFDADNGILLSAHIDALFDKHLISFDAKGDMLYAPSVKDQLQLKAMLGTRLSKPMSAKLAAYMKRHRDIFLDRT